MRIGPLLSIRLREGHRRRLLLSFLVGVALFLAFTLAGASQVQAAHIFPDVPGTHPYVVAIQDLADRGIILGYADGRFGPDDLVTRQQFAKMVVLAGEYAVSPTAVCPFVDVDEQLGSDPLYPSKYVAVAAASGITVGKTPTSFDPYSNITRYQVVTMVVRAADDLQTGLLMAPPAGWMGTPGWSSDPTHGQNARRAEYNGLLTGLDLPALNPLGKMTRGEVAQVLFNLRQALSGAITPAMIRQLAAGASAFTPEQIQVVDYNTFGDWAVALVAVTGQESPIFIFKKVGGTWTVADGGTDFVEADLQSAGVPVPVINWIKAKGFVSS